MTATSANGLALMWEVLYIAASNRCPIVMSLVNRALSGPINIHCDHSDVMGMRDAGWIVLFSESGQEAYDNAIQAVRIAEHPDVLLPVAVCQDGFITSHGMERVEVHDDDKVRAFIGTYQPRWPLLDLEKPKTYGPLDFYDYYYEHKRQQIEAMAHAEGVIGEVAAEFNGAFGRNYGLFEAYRLDDAEVAVVAEALAGTKAVAVMDRAVSFGAADNAGPLFLELAAALAVQGVRVPVRDYVFGLGGRDIRPSEIEGIYRDLLQTAATGRVDQVVTYLGVRE